MSALPTPSGDRTSLHDIRVLADLCAREYVPLVARTRRKVALKAEAVEALEIARSQVVDHRVAAWGSGDEGRLARSQDSVNSSGRGSPGKTPETVEMQLDLIQQDLMNALAFGCFPQAWPGTRPSAVKELLLQLCEYYDRFVQAVAIPDAMDSAMEAVGFDDDDLDEVTRMVTAGQQTVETEELQDHPSLATKAKEVLALARMHTAPSTAQLTPRASMTTLLDAFRRFNIAWGTIVAPHGFEDLSRGLEALSSTSLVQSQLVCMDWLWRLALKQEYQLWDECCHVLQTLITTCGRRLTSEQRREFVDGLVDTLMVRIEGVVYHVQRELETQDDAGTVMGQWKAVASSEPTIQRATRLLVLIVQWFVSTLTSTLTELPFTTGMPRAGNNSLIALLPSLQTRKDLLIGARSVPAFHQSFTAAILSLRKWMPLDSIRAMTEVPVPARMLLDRMITLIRAGRQGEIDVNGSLSEERGFLPVLNPVSQLPETHSAWDDLAHNLPQLWRTGGIKQAVDHMPLLSGAEAALPSQYLLRAATILGLLANGYHHFGLPSHSPLPKQLRKPWAQVNARLRRRAPTLHYMDLVLNNWQMVDGDDSAMAFDSMTFQNVQLMIPFFAVRAEHVFFVAMVMMHATTACLVGQIVRAQEAAVTGNHWRLMSELVGMRQAVERATSVFNQIDPRPSSATYCDPVEWAQTVGVLPIPINFKDGVRGASGIEAPMFHLLDVALGRVSYESGYGKDAIIERSQWLPVNQREFLEAVGQVSLRDRIRDLNDPALSAAWTQLVDAYAGESGLLGAHHIKAYGYLESAMKVGRHDMNATLAGSQSWADKNWQTVVGHLEEARKERLPTAIGCPFMNAKIRQKLPTCPAGNALHVELDIGETPMSCQAGNVVEIVGLNRPLVVEGCLSLLHTDGDFKIRITPAWETYLSAIGVSVDSEHQVQLQMLLSHAELRHIGTEALHGILQLCCNDIGSRERLKDVFSSTFGWDLFDLLHAMRALRQPPGALLSGTKLAELMHPLRYRYFSIASKSNRNGGPMGLSCMLELAVGAIQEPRSYHATLLLASGTAAVPTTAPAVVKLLSARMAQPPAAVTGLIHDTMAAEESSTLQLRVIPAHHFEAPADPSVPVVLFANGLGLAPMRAFIHERCGNPQAGDTWLFLSVPTPNEFHFREELEHLVASNSTRFNLHVGYSRQVQALGWKALAKSRLVSTLATGSLSASTTLGTASQGAGAAGSDDVSNSSSITASIAASAGNHDWADDGEELVTASRSLNSSVSDFQDFEVRGSFYRRGRITTKMRMPVMARCLWGLISGTAVEGVPSPWAIQPGNKKSGHAPRISTLGFRGSGAYVYLCGTPSFLQDVERELFHLIEGKLSGSAMSGPSPVGAARQYLAAMASQGRYSVHVFGPPPSTSRLPMLQMSAVMAHYTAAVDGRLWTVIDDLVVDFTEYMLLHPGGDKVCRDKAGIDCTSDFYAAHARGTDSVKSIMYAYGVGRLQTYPGPACGLGLFKAAVKTADVCIRSMHAIRLQLNQYETLGYRTSRMPRRCESFDLARIVMLSNMPMVCQSVSQLTTVAWDVPLSDFSGSSTWVLPTGDDESRRNWNTALRGTHATAVLKHDCLNPVKEFDYDEVVGQELVRIQLVMHEHWTEELISLVSALEGEPPHAKTLSSSCVLAVRRSIVRISELAMESVEQLAMVLKTVDAHVARNNRNKRCVML